MEARLSIDGYPKFCIPSSNGKQGREHTGLNSTGNNLSSCLTACAKLSSPSKQFRASVVKDNSHSSTEELVPKNDRDARSPAFSPLTLLTTDFSVPSPLRFLWFNVKDDFERKDQDELVLAGEAERDDNEGLSSCNDEDEIQSDAFELKAQETGSNNKVSMEAVSLGKVENDESNSSSETQVYPMAKSPKITSPDVSSTLRHLMYKIAALWPDPSYFRSRNIQSFLDPLNGSFDTSGPDDYSDSLELASNECDMKDNGCRQDVPCSCSLEVPYTKVLHTRESFSVFLQSASLWKMKDFTELIFLCDMAYTIPNIKTVELLKYHGLKLITSSVEKRAMAEAKLRETELPEKSRLSDTRSDNLNSSNDAAQSDLSLLDNGSSSVPHFQQPSDSYSELIKSPMPDELELKDSSMAAASPAVLAEERRKMEAAKDSPSTNPCPCEWFVCDKEQDCTRIFVIQGSESLASWQANLFFEPTQFEGLEVFVHRGIYEAAEALYDQVLAETLDHFSIHGNRARVRFTGHSLGGSLALLLSLMLQIRGVLPHSVILPVVTFGSPYIMCGGDYLLQKMQLPKSHIQSVIMHRDVVPRAFACDYPDHVAEVLRRLNRRFRNHPCLNAQKLLYSPMGELYILQPDSKAAPSHPLLPDGYCLFRIGYPPHMDEVKNANELRAAQRAFLNLPHPLDILSDPGAYGFDGTVSRDHDPRSYMKAIQLVLKDEARRVRQVTRQERRKRLWPLVVTKSSDTVISTHSTWCGVER
ncbi:hypothetical protein KP509_15G041800 [Ceratopteris richardii]|uniref:Fungal lipase-type domain-containing protein n=1 Tax=Ceratopteris richardii TaxID=49495 RepID=A0A8T2T6G3_CERRI|nr:hypothetical protein KP509_15G041800 [Ceratopteris richardii]